MENILYNITILKSSILFFVSCDHMIMAMIYMTYVWYFVTVMDNIILSSNFRFKNKKIKLK